MKNENGKALPENRSLETEKMKMPEKDKQAEELTVSLGFLKIAARGRSAIRAVARSVSFFLAALAVSIVVVSAGYSMSASYSPEFMRSPVQWGLERLGWR